MSESRADTPPPVSSDDVIEQEHREDAMHEKKGPAVSIAEHSTSRSSQAPPEDFEAFAEPLQSPRALAYKTVKRYLVQIPDSASKARKAAYRAIFFTEFLFIFGVLGTLLSATERSDEARDEDRGNHAESNFLVRLAAQIIVLLKKLLSPTTFWVPALALIITFASGFKKLNQYQTTFAGTEELHASCPENNRRTVNATLIKVLAAVVTTVAINGHLGSLSGKQTWKRELLRAIEVLLTPLRPLFTFVSMLYHEFCGKAAFCTDRSPVQVGWRYRFARICRVRVSTKDAFVGFTNPRHLHEKQLTRGLTWYGRFSLLSVLLAQYIQAAILLTRRFMSGTQAYVDVAMLLLVICGITALTQSLIISLVNTEWTQRDDFQPCIERACSLKDCVALKKEHKLPDDTWRPEYFGWISKDIARWFLLALTAAHLQQIVLNQSKESVAKQAWMFLGMYWIWKMSFLFFIYFNSTMDMWGGALDSEPAKPETTEPLIGSSTPPDSPTPLEPEVTASPEPNITTSQVSNPESEERPDDSKPASRSSRVWSWVFHIMWHPVLLTGGLIYMIAGIFFTLLVVLQAIVPLTSIVVFTANDLSQWSAQSTDKPCPALWKDNMEDLLWWF